MKSEIKNCQNCHKDFIIEPDDFSFYEKMKVPPPNVCPDCRFKMRAMWRNEMSLYNRKCAKTDESIISSYNPKSFYCVVSHEYYNSDDWDARDFAIEYDFKKTFFKQLGELLKIVPKPATFLSVGDGPNINSPYSNYAGGLKNCYFAFNSGPMEESLYTRGIRFAKEVLDCYFGVGSELMYECVNCQKSSKVTYSRNVVSCVDCHFLTNTSGCINCFGCVNLRNASHQIFNKQVSKEEYYKTINDILGSYKKIEKFKKQFIEFEKTLPMRESHNIKSINSTGDYLFECKNVRNSFEVTKAEDSKFLFFSKDTKDSYGTTGYSSHSERLLECVGVGFSFNVIGSCAFSNCQDIMYSYFLRNCHDCIGCDGLRNAEYCILNKQYTKEEYEKLKEHIIKELTEKGIHGLIMPPEIAPFAYNETIAQDNMPLTKEEALSQGFRWEDDIQMTKGKETLKTENIPDHIKDVSDSITNEILKCINCERNYKITEQELLFYRKMILPIPRKCFFCRHRDRIHRRGPFKFSIRKCSHCGKDTHTNLTEEVAPIMYCEKCYQQEVI